MPKRKVIGPYRVKNIGANGPVYEVVALVNNQSNTWEELRPRYTTLSRQAAFGKCLRLNRRWQDDLNPDELDLIDYWKEASK
jgi:hypothetical protein